MSRPLSPLSSTPSSNNAKRLSRPSSPRAPDVAEPPGPSLKDMTIKEAPSRSPSRSLTSVSLHKGQSSSEKDGVPPESGTNTGKGNENSFLEMIRNLTAEGHDKVSKENFKEVLRHKMEERESCFSMPFTIVFFVFYMMMVLAHEDVYTTYRTERAIRNLVESVSCEGSEFKLSDAVVPSDVWRWLHESIVCKDSEWFQQTDLQGTILPREEWGRVLFSNRLYGGLVLEQSRTQRSECDVQLPYEWDCFPKEDQRIGESATFGHWASVSKNFNRSLPEEYANVLYYENEGFSPLFQNIGEGESRLLSKGLRGQEVAGVNERIWDFQQAVPWERYPFFFLEQEPMEVLNKRLKYLVEGAWIDGQSELITLKANLVNAEVKLVTRVTIIFRFGLPGGMDVALRLQSSPMSLYKNSFWGPAIDGVWLVMLCIIFLWVVKDSLKAKKKGLLKEYFQDVWNWVDILSVFFGFIIILGFAVQREAIDRLLAAMHTVDFNREIDRGYLQELHKMHQLADNIVRGTMWYRILLGDYVLLLMLRFFKAYRAQPRLALVTATMTAAAADLLHFAIVFMSIFMSFAYASVVLFGRKIQGFSSFWQAVATCWAIICGDLSWAEISVEHPVTAALWFTTFMLLTYFVLLNMVLAVVMDVYTEIRTHTIVGDTLWVQVKKACFSIFRQGIRESYRSQKEDRQLLKQLEEAEMIEISQQEICKMCPNKTEKQIEDLFAEARVIETTEESKGMGIMDSIRLISSLSKDVILIRDMVQQFKYDKSWRHIQKKVTRSLEARSRRAEEARDAMLDALYSGKLKAMLNEFRKNPRPIPPRMGSKEAAATATAAVIVKKIGAETMGMSSQQQQLLFEEKLAPQLATLQKRIEDVQSQVNAKKMEPDAMESLKKMEPDTPESPKQMEPETPNQAFVVEKLCELMGYMRTMSGQLNSVITRAEQAEKERADVLRLVPEPEVPLPPPQPPEVTKVATAPHQKDAVDDSYQDELAASIWTNLSGAVREAVRIEFQIQTQAMMYHMQNHSELLKVEAHDWAAQLQDSVRKDVRDLFKLREARKTPQKTQVVVQSLRPHALQHLENTENADEAVKMSPKLIYTDEARQTPSTPVSAKFQGESAFSGDSNDGAALRPVIVPFVVEERRQQPLPTNSSPGHVQVHSQDGIQQYQTDASEIRDRQMPCVTEEKGYGAELIDVYEGGMPLPSGLPFVAGPSTVEETPEFIGADTAVRHGGVDQQTSLDVAEEEPEANSNRAGWDPAVSQCDAAGGPPPGASFSSRGSRDKHASSVVRPLSAPPEQRVGDVTTDGHALTYAASAMSSAQAHITTDAHALTPGTTPASPAMPSAPAHATSDMHALTHASPAMPSATTHLTTDVHAVTHAAPAMPATDVHGLTQAAPSKPSAPAQEEPALMPAASTMPSAPAQEVLTDEGLQIYEDSDLSFSSPLDHGIPHNLLPMGMGEISQSRHQPSSSSDDLRILAPGGHSQYNIVMDDQGPAPIYNAPEPDQQGGYQHYTVMIDEQGREMVSPVPTFGVPGTIPQFDEGQVVLVPRAALHRPEAHHVAAPQQLVRPMVSGGRRHAPLIDDGSLGALPEGVLPVMTRFADGPQGVAPQRFMRVPLQRLSDEIEDGVFMYGPPPSALPFAQPILVRNPHAVLEDANHLA